MRTKSHAFCFAALIVLLGAASQTSAAPVSAPPGLVAWWPGNGNTKDIVGGNDGTLSGASYVDGKVGQAFAVSGPGAMVVIPSSPSITFGQHSPMSIELWVYSTGNGHILGKRGPQGGEWQFYGGGGGGLSFITWGGGVSTSGPLLPFGDWAHVAVTYDGSTFSLYINGTLDATGTGSLGDPSWAAPLELGASDIYGGFSGRLDEVSIYNRCLTADEVAGVYHGGASGKVLGLFIYTQPQSQVAYWGKPATFAVSGLGGTPPYTYQWLKDGNPVEGATENTFTLPSVQTTDAGSYTVTVTDAASATATSAVAILTVNPAGVSIATCARLTIDGAVGQTYGIQVSTNLNAGSWTGAANVTLTQPIQDWYDSQSTAQQPKRFYRVVAGPIPIP